MNLRRALVLPCLCALIFVAPRSASSPRASGAAAPPASASAAAASDPVLQAMLQELERSKSRLKMDGVPSPFYIEYHLLDSDDYQLQAEFGSTQFERRGRFRFAHVLVRVGDYHLDSYFENGMGESVTAPLDDDPLAIRHALWLATDSAFKAASEALTTKQGLYKRFAIEQTVDDFTREPAVESVLPLAKLQFDPARWRSLLESATGLYREFPDVQSVSASARFSASNAYFVNTEGTVLRSGNASYAIAETGSTQAPDGMRLERSPGDLLADPAELPSAAKLEADTRAMLENLVKLRQAPIVDEEYRGPVLFAADAVNDVMEVLVAANIIGRKPPPTVSSRTLGAFSSSYHSRVLPDFLSLVDDPGVQRFSGKTLTGSYPVDDEGVRGAAVTVVEKGALENFLMGRRPIRGFPQSNGHGRITQNGVTDPSIGVLMLRPAQPLSRDALFHKLVDLCRSQERPYCYFVDTLGPRLSPRVLYRVWSKDGRQELVRGAEFQELDTRSLRSDVIAAGDDFLVSNRLGATPRTIISPSLLFDELVVKRADLAKEKLPEYPSPALPSARKP